MSQKAMNRQKNGTLWLRTRQWSAFRGGLLALGAVVLIATTVMAAWPRAVDALMTSELQYRVDTTAPVLRNVVTGLRSTALPQQASQVPSESIATDVTADLQSRFDRLPDPLRTVVTPPQAATRSDPIPTTGPVFNYHYRVQLEGFDGLKAVSTLVSGHWPSGTPHAGDTSDIQIVLTTTTAHRMGWTVGAARPVSFSSELPPRSVRLVGLIRPHSAADFWRLDPTRASPALENLGDGPPPPGGFRLTAIGWVDPGLWRELVTQVSAETTGWYGVRASAFRESDLPVLQQQLARFLSGPAQGRMNLHLTTQLGDTLSAFVAGEGSARTLMLLLGVGPLSAAAAVLILGVQLLVRRRQPALDLVSARGASALQVRGGVGIDVLLVSVPAAIAGATIALVVIPGAPGFSTALIAAICAIVPACVMAAGASPTAVSDRAARTRRRVKRWRWMLEVIVAAVAVLAVAALVQRGLVPPAGGNSVDPLVVATPLLVCLAVCVLVLRAVPFGLRWLSTVLRRRPGVVGFVGALRGERTLGATLVPLFSVLVGIAVLVFSSTVLSTTAAGLVQSARGSVGADVSVTATRLTSDALKSIRAVPGVTRTVPISSVGYGTLSAGGATQTISLFAADTKALSQLQAALPAERRTPDLLVSERDGRVPVLLGGWQPSGSANGTLELSGTVPVRIVSQSVTPGSFITVSPWLLIDSRFAKQSEGFSAPVVTTVLLQLAPDADAAGVASRVRATVAHDSTTVIRVAADEQRSARNAPAVGGLSTLLAAATLLSAILALAAVVLALGMNAAARERLNATLRALGFSRRQGVALVAWEIGPFVVAGLLGGVGAGILLPFLLLPPLDLTAFTGAAAQPVIMIDAALVVLVAVGFLAVSAALTAAALAVASRRNAARILRRGEDE